ncbi:MAG: hypothetical protein ACUVQG_11095 [Thermogutta sp.]
MSVYRVVITEAPSDWSPTSLDDVPPHPPEPKKQLAEYSDLFAAVQAAIEHNRQTQRGSNHEWAVVCETGSSGKMWRGLRICTPLRYKIASIWWPPGWEPVSPFDVPLCVCRTQGTLQEDLLTYEGALATMKALNQQAIDRASTLWYVMIAVENEPVSRSISYDPAGLQTTVEIRKIHIAQPAEGGRGDCSHCPARGLDCTMAAAE